MLVANILDYCYDRDACSCLVIHRVNVHNRMLSVTVLLCIRLSPNFEIVDVWLQAQREAGIKVLHFIPNSIAPNHEVFLLLSSRVCSPYQSNLDKFFLVSWLQSFPNRMSF
jgi:hypothetical protein